MKKFLGLLSCILIFASCDDGNITTKGITFDPTKPIISCPSNNGLYYKINGPEALILETPTSSFANEVTPDKPRTILIDNSTTKLLLRSFNATVTDSYFCSVIPPSSPAVTEEWTALSGVQDQSEFIEITTTMLINQTTKDTTYNHNVVFKNVTFANSKSSFVYDNYVFGNYTTTP